MENCGVAKFIATGLIIILKRRQEYETISTPGSTHDVRLLKLASIYMALGSFGEISLLSIAFNSSNNFGSFLSFL